MRIDSVNPIPPTVAEHLALDPAVKPVPNVTPAVQDYLDVKQKHSANSTSVLVEIKPGNIVVYKFIDETNGQVIQQIPSAQMLNLADAIESIENPKK